MARRDTYHVFSWIILHIVVTTTTEPSLRSSFREKMSVVLSPLDAPDWAKKGVSRAVEEAFMEKLHQRHQELAHIRHEMKAELDADRGSVLEAAPTSEIPVEILEKLHNQHESKNPKKTPQHSDTTRNQNIHTKQNITAAEIRLNRTSTEKNTTSDKLLFQASNSSTDSPKTWVNKEQQEDIESNPQSEERLATSEKLVFDEDDEIDRVNPFWQATKHLMSDNFQRSRDGVVVGASEEWCKQEGGWWCSFGNSSITSPAEWMQEQMMKTNHWLQGKADICVLKEKRCDAVRDCPRGDDEGRESCPEDCQSQPHTHHCQSGHPACVSSVFTCDGRRDCQDGSDESWDICRHVCLPLEGRHGTSAVVTEKPAKFLCASGRVACVAVDVTCDGLEDCDDGSDEDDDMCLARCQQMDRPFYCRDGRPLCIDGRQQCDGVAECHDGSDEDDRLCQSRCQLDIDNPFYCHLGLPTCLPEHKVCDGHPDCHKSWLYPGQLTPVIDWSDEDSATCGEYCHLAADTTFTCHLSHLPLCIPDKHVCDGVKNCLGGEDESRETCSAGCQEDAFLCESGERTCVARYMVCDGTAHCQYGQDESRETCPLLYQ